MNITLATPKPKDGFTPYGPPLGLCYLSAYLKANGYPQVAGVDLNVDDLSDYLTAVKDSDLVGIYCSTKTFAASLALAGLAKREGCTVVFGGPHPTLCPDETLADDNVDFVVRGDGEVTLLELVRLLDAGSGEPPKLAGLSFRDKLTGRVVHNPERPLLADLNQLPFPDFTPFRMDRYPSVDVNIAASRGCPYKCANCQPALNSVSGRFRRRTVASVIEEIAALRKGGLWGGYLHFVDNDLTISRKWIEEFCHGLLGQGIKMRWACEGRANTLDRELMTLMKRAGCRMVGMGVESGSGRVLAEVVDKGFTLDRVVDVVRWANEVGLEIHCWFMIGIPGETTAEMRETIDLATSLNAASIGFSVGTPWPGTKFYETCRRKGYMLSENWDDYNEKRVSRLQTEHFCPDDVEAARQLIFQRFAAKGWRVDEATFIVQNPFYNRSLGGKAFFVIQSIVYALLGHERAVRLYGRLRRITLARFAG